MKVKVIAAFNDMSIADPTTRRRETGAEFDVDDARGIELSALKLVEPVGAEVVQGVPFGLPPLDMAPQGQAAIGQPAAASVSDTLHLTGDMAAPTA